MFQTIRRLDNSLLGTNELFGVPEGRENATEEQVLAWLEKRHENKEGASGKVFRNLHSHFLLDWSEIDIPNPAFSRRELDLSLKMWPEVASPYKFPEYIYEFDDSVVPSGIGPGPSGEGRFLSQEQITIEPPLYDDNLNLINQDVEVRIVKQGFSLLGPVESGMNFLPQGSTSGYFIPDGEFGIRVYTTYNPSGLIPVKAKRPGNIYDISPGEVLHCAPHHWLAEDRQNEVYGKDYLTAGGSGFMIGGSEVGPPAASGLIQASASGGMNTTFFDAMDLGPNQEMFDDNFWEWYRWEDEADEYRKFFFNKIQAQFIPRNGEAYGMLLHNVIGMSQGGNNDRAWVDPIYYDQISPTMHHKMFRDVSHCYKVDKCNFAKNVSSPEVGGEVFLIEDKGFKKNEYAQISDGDAYCRYRQSEADASRKSNMKLGGDWDRYCKYAGVPQRAIEFDENYKILLRDILRPFRIYGIYYWSGFFNEEQFASQEPVGNGYSLVSIKQLPATNTHRYILGQMNYEEGVEGSHPEENDIPAGKILFFYTNPAPEEPPSSYQDQDAIYTAHKNSKVFAYLWQETHEGKKRWLVELKDDYVSPAYRVSEFQVFDAIKGGENPFVKDKKFTGKNAGGLRFRLEKNPDSGVWRVEYPYDINPSGFFNLEGGNVQLTGITDEAAQIHYFNSGLPPVFVDVPSCLSKGTVRPVGLPGEIIEKKSIFWKSPTVIKWDHILELHDKLLEPTNEEEKYDTPMESSMSADGKILYSEDRLEPSDVMGGLVKKDEPNHILIGSFQDGISGTGMVSNGDTPYSDIILLSDVLHARNMVLPMIPYRLAPYISNETAEYFDDDIQDFATRQTEPHHLTVKRYGFREPGIYCFMSNYLDGNKLDEDVSYTIMVPVSQNPFITSSEMEGHSPGERNKIYRIFHPNGMRWWKDNGLLGCGIQYGKVDSDSGYLGYGEAGARGSGLTQVGTAVVNFFRQNLPLDKELVACYLRLRPTYANEISSYVVKTAGGGRQWINGNSAFYNVTFTNPAFDNYFDALNGLESYNNVDYELRLIWEEEHQHDGQMYNYPFNENRAFCKALKFKRQLCGDFEFPWQGSLEEAGPVTKPSGGDDTFFDQYDLERTKRGHFLDNIDITVKAGTEVLTFKTGQRSKAWYETWMPTFMNGVHSKTDCFGLCSRLDYDEGGNVDSNNKGRGMGYACDSGGWAKDHRVFDITNVARKAYISDRFDAKYSAVVDLTISDMGESYNLVLLQPEPKTNYISLGEVAIFDRVTDSSEGLFYENLIENNIPFGTEGQINYAVINLKQIPPPRIVEGVTLIDDPVSVASTRKLRDNCIVETFKSTAEGVLEKDVAPYLAIFARPKLKMAAQAGGWRLIKSITEPSSQEDEGSNFSLTINHTLINYSQFREVMVISNLKITSFEVLGWITESWPSQVPMTDPPIFETHMFDKIIVDKIFDKDAGDYALAFLQVPATKIYEVLVAPMLPSNFENGFNCFKNGETSLKLTYKGLFDPNNMPEFVWEVENKDTPEERWYVVSGEYAYSSSMNAVILPTIYKFNKIPKIDDPDKLINTKVASLESLGVTVSYVSGRGAKSEIKIIASGSGPGYDVDPDTIIEVTDIGASQLGTPSGEFYGTEYLPWSCTNKNELKGGYLEGEIPDNANAPLENYFTPRNGIETKAWSSYCKGLLEVYGEPDMLINAGEFMAPAFVEDTDPVTGEKRVNNLKFESGIDPYRVPNGGRLPLNINIELSTSDGIDLYGSEDEYRKKQVAYIPEVYVYLRERVPDFFQDSQTTWSLNLG